MDRIKTYRLGLLVIGTAGKNNVRPRTAPSFYFFFFFAPRHTKRSSLIFYRRFPPRARCKALSEVDVNVGKTDFRRLSTTARVDRRHNSRARVVPRVFGRRTETGRTFATLGFEKRAET